MGHIIQGGHMGTTLVKSILDAGTQFECYAGLGRPTRRTEK
jgi:hypothetical protein